VTDWLGQRKHPRYPIVAPVLYGLEGSDSVVTVGGWTRDLSEGGACLELPDRVEVSALIRVFLRMDQGGYSTEGRVIWAERPPQTEGGFYGVAISQMVSAQHEVLRAFLSRKRMVWQAVVRIPLDCTVTYQVKGQPRSPRQGHTENVSRRGLLLRLPSMHASGTSLEVVLHTPHGHLVAGGTVVRVDPREAQTPREPIRHGFQFTDISHATQMTLGRVLAEAR